MEVGSKDTHIIAPPDSGAIPTTNPSAIRRPGPVLRLPLNRPQFIDTDMCSRSIAFPEVVAQRLVFILKGGPFPDGGHGNLAKLVVNVKARVHVAHLGCHFFDRASEGKHFAVAVGGGYLPSWDEDAIARDWRAGAWGILAKGPCLSREFKSLYSRRTHTETYHSDQDSPRERDGQ